MSELKLPDMGENIDEAEVLRVLVSVGDRIEKDQPVLELETDKATFEVPSSLEGTVGEVHVGEGDRLKVGQTILSLTEGDTTGDGGAGKGKGDDGSDGDERTGKAPTKKKKEAKKQKGAKSAKEESPSSDGEEAEEAEEGEEGEEGEGSEKAEGRMAKKDDAVDESTPPADEGGSREGDRSGEGGEEAEGEGTSEGAGVVAGPATRRLARELGVNIDDVQASGAGGRVTADDVKAAVRQGSAPSRGEGEARSLEGLERWGPVERRRLSGVERAAMGHLSASWRGIPHVTQHDVADVTELETMRRRFEEGRGPSDPKITPTALVVKAVVAALRAFPRVNASLDVGTEELVLKRYYHIGVAVDTDDGLLVPVVRDADRKTTREIASEIAGLAERARERKLARDEMQGASFTVTNLGGIGGTSFTPIVSHPQVAILGVSRVREEAVIREGDLAVRLVMPLSLSYDHRAVNGADAARFARRVASLLEDPLRLLAET